MKFNFQNKISIVLLLMVFQLSFAQKKDENIGSEVVNVVKPYTATLSDAFKVPEAPVLDDAGNAKKETIKYSIFSFPVASTFTPSKGKAEGVDKTKQARLYDNYATLGFGNYRTLNAELFVNHQLNNNDYVGGMFRHLSSQGGISGVELDDRFYDTSVDLTYGSNYKDMSWNIDLGYQNQIYNWYGLPEGFGNTLMPSGRADLLNGIDPQHSYTTFSLGSKISFKEGFFNEAAAKFSHFTDNFGSAENRFFIKPSLQFDVMEEAVKTNIIVDYVGGSFEKNYMNNAQLLKYGYTNLGVSPSFVMQQDDWTLNLGASVFYSIDTENSNNKFFVYPNINASYKVVGDLMIFYAGAEGSLEQNSYLDFVDGNSFLSPTLNIAPTDKQYDVFAGLKGKLANNVSYNIRGSYRNERNKALYKSNDYSEDITNEDYAFGNSMQVVYDDMRTLSFSGDLKADFSDNVTFGVSGTFNSFTNDFQAEAWNLPTVKLNSNIDFNITEKWYAGAAVFYVGDRKDIKTNTNIVANYSATTLDSYFDVNAHLGYKYSDRLTGFLRANNITNQAYQKWLNYPVQGFQIVVGANYKFDF
ncbi:TonB-dependent receptor [Flavobacterium acetivorans]|uniref:TonB-dependent receptor n=1 Tax=Flavobacterium acetivorans TaxID=2893883 RepID=UPI001E5605F5|nr:TonB-dependent receptor [Flavobacterium sp. F-29]UFH35419.1 TonB-dependent receptor [Flavobacterium sp. F-29]